MALGAFLAGVLLADSEYRHELEADIEPFKGLLLGLFFMAVGMTMNLGLVTGHSPCWRWSWDWWPLNRCCSTAGAHGQTGSRRGGQSGPVYFPRR
jgi:hypothetical protein